MSGRWVWSIVAVLALTAGYVCWCELPLVWDGAFQLSVTLLRQQPFVYLTRFHTLILWQPTVWLSRVTDNPFWLQAVYGFPFIIAPAVSVAVSWWVVRKQMPGLIIWALFGVAAGTLPGQVFIINDSIWQQTLFWPIFLSLFVNLTRPQVWVLSILGVFQFVHQIGLPLFLGAAMTAVFMGAVDPDNRSRYRERAKLMAALAMLALAKILITSSIPAFEDTYAEKEFAWWVVKERWNYGVAGYPLTGLIFAWTAAIAILLHSSLNRRAAGKLLCGLAVVLVIATGGIWLHWASDPHLWNKALDYRRWILPLSAPFFLLAFLEAFIHSQLRIASAHMVMQEHRSTKNTKAQPERLQKSEQLQRTGQSGFFRGAAAGLLACVFAGVMGMQATVWHRMLGRLRAQVQASPELIVPLESISWAKGTPLDHWATSDAITFLQGKQPRKLLLTDEQIADLYRRPPIVPNQGWFRNPRSYPPPPGPAGWYDFRPFLKQLAATSPPPVPQTPAPPVAGRAKPSPAAGSSSASSQ